MCNKWWCSILLYALLMMGTTSKAHAWWENGHLLVAEIAYQGLDPIAKQKADQLIQLLTPFYPSSNHFVGSSTWADEIKGNHRWHLFDSSHYTNRPYDPYEFLTHKQLAVIAAQNTRNDVLWALHEGIATLRESKTNDFEKALMLRFLIHFVADIHQPLHTTTFYSPEHPSGDRGGNLYEIVGMGKTDSLHKLWDNGLGAFPEVPSTLTPGYLEEISTFATLLMKKYPQDQLQESNVLDVKEWAEESHQLAINFAYQTPERQVPSEDYIYQGQEIALRRVVLAGYRLSNLLNSLMGSKDCKNANNASLETFQMQLTQ